MPNTVSALAIVIHPLARGQHISEFYSSYNEATCEQNGFHSMLAPVRPSFKTKYSLIPMAEYAYWIRDDGLHG